MADTGITGFRTFQRRPERRLDRCSPALRYGLDLPPDLLFIIGRRRLHHPVKSVVKGDNAHIVRIAHLVHRCLCRRNRQIQAGGTAPHGYAHTARVIDDHDHGHGRNLIDALKLHIHRQHSLQNALPITAQCKAVIAADADEPAPVILHAGLYICQKAFRQIGEIDIFQ